MKRIVLCALALCLLCSACSNVEERSHGSSNVLHTVKEHRALLLACVAEMEAFGLDRIYVAIEAPKTDNEEEKEEPVTTEPAEPRLVSFEKETDDRTEIENETLEKAIRTLGLELIFFQTASDARRVVIFSFSRENDSGVQHGFYYSYDALPAAWWGRKADLVRKDNKWLQISKKGDAWYYTLLLEDSFYYYEKNGYLMA